MACDICGAKTDVLGTCLRCAVARIARAWGVSDSVVRKARDGDAPLTDFRIRALPRAQREHLHEVLDSTAQLSLF